MKVFISQPMKGLTDEQILTVRKKAIRHLKKTIGSVWSGEIEIIDSFFQDAPVEAKPLWYLGKSLELLSTADLCLFVGDWQNARGCRIEHMCCGEYGIRTIYFDWE